MGKVAGVAEKQWAVNTGACVVATSAIGMFLATHTLFNIHPPTGAAPHHTTGLGAFHWHLQHGCARDDRAGVNSQGGARSQPD